MQRSLLFLIVISAVTAVTCKKDAIPEDKTKLEAPQEYQLYSAQANRSISLKWGDFRICNWPCPPVIKPIKYQVFISESGPDNFRFHTELPPSQSDLTIHGLQNGKPYLFKVVVIGKRDSMATTNMIMATPLGHRINEEMQYPEQRSVVRSFDGRFDAFTAYRAESGGTLFVQQGPSAEVMVSGYAQAPAWAPADYRLAYQTGDGLTHANYPQHIYIYDVERGEHRQVVGGQRRNIEPTWSPDGSLLLFLSDRGGESASYDIWSVDVADTAKVNRLTTIGATDEVLSGIAPTWSPDGSKIAFTVAPLVNGNTYPYSLRIVEMDADGNNRRTLIESSWNDYNPIYSPSGDRIAFLSDRSGAREIWTMTLATGALKQLTYSDNLEQPSYYVQGNMQWSPDGEKLYFIAVKNGAVYGYFYVDSADYTP